jgi:hypothetical protein
MRRAAPTKEGARRSGNSDGQIPGDDQISLKIIAKLSHRLSRCKQLCSPRPIWFR